ncbi:TetR family transcriptional regulator [Reticulibacter mediterranei]|uniref:TetR family transcriptional regulator n=1 Tax=Reticulibacter mediterranei TaxID=2778369 RepID=A0A8J3IAI9_9CHLR|nr:TetR/AcrR family transcriptional regulator [Reticulibacter mediterranei]GHO90033.1 TetR family transcriptional regulator [Reticulibacter mediterranei]
MAEPGSKRGLVRDARRAREVILDAAEAVFAEHGFDGARIDAIAKASGYNISLLFQYFGDKLGLYTEVLKRTDQDLTALQAQILAPMLEHAEGSIPTQKMRNFLVTVVQTLFNYLLEHPRFLRILTWEMAEGWQIYKQIATHLQSEDREPFDRLFQQGEQTRLLRSSFTPLIQLAMITPICQSYLASLPLYQVMLPEEDLSSREALFRAREHLVTLIVGGMLVDPQAPGSDS